LDSIKI